MSNQEWEGISKWIEYGKKYGYFDYVRKNVIDECLGVLPEEKQIPKSAFVPFGGYLVSLLTMEKQGFNACRSEVIERLNNLKEGK